MFIGSKKLFFKFFEFFAELDIPLIPIPFSIFFLIDIKLFPLFLFVLYLLLKNKSCSLVDSFLTKLKSIFEICALCIVA